MRKRLIEIVLQIIPIAIGVYLGFFVSNWADASKRQNQADRLLESIKSEIQNNKSIIENVIDYHLMLRDSSWYYSQHAKSGFKPTFFEGTQTQQLTGSAYSTGLQTGIVNELPLAKIQSLNNLYNDQAFYNDFGKTVTNGLIMMDFTDENERNIRRVAQYLSLTMTDIVIQEENLINSYNKVLEILE